MALFQHSVLNTYLSGINEEKLNMTDWFETFTQQKGHADELKFQISKTDKEIDKIVYELYGLTGEEVKVVENSSK
jgi:inorganic triphosphatase YgiF